MLPIFDLKPLKKEFYSSLMLSLLIAFAGYVLVTFGFIPPLPSFTGKSVFIVLFGIFIAFQVWHQKLIKKLLKTSAAASEMDEKFLLYGKYYKMKLFYSVADVAINTVFFVLTLNNWFLYLNIIPIGFVVMSFPGKALIERELQDNAFEVTG